jgi:hypothetical protein
MKVGYALLLITVFFSSFMGWCQSIVNTYFDDIQIRIDTNTFRWSEDSEVVGDEQKLTFYYEQSESLAEFRFYPKAGQNTKIISLPSTASFGIIDSIQFVNDAYYSARIKFKNLSNTEHLNIMPIIKKSDGSEARLNIPLLPYTNTYASVYTGDGELFIGEEKSFEIVTNNADNLAFDTRWQKSENYEFRIHRRGEKLLFTIVPSQRGELNVGLSLEVLSPIADSNFQLTYKLPTIQMQFNVKGSRLSFLRFDEREVVWERDVKEGVEVQIDNNRNLAINKTYRMEASDEPGGALIAELFTLRRLSNDKVLCVFRPYNYHRTRDSYLFIKDGDTPVFITNINIVPESRIDKVSILRNGGNWEENTSVYPGETVEVRLEGESLLRGDFIFKGLRDVSSDTIIRSDRVVNYLLKVPIDIRQKSISIYNGDRKTGKSLDIIEYQRPRLFDYIILDHGTSPKVVQDITQPILHNGTIGDVSIQFDPLYIDEPDYLYGKQYLEIEVRIKDQNNIVEERYTIDNIVICPGETSPRFFAYNGKGSDCNNGILAINDYISNKTHSLNNWSSVELVFRNKKSAYNGKGFSHRVQIFKQKLITFDVDLSIPAGLLIKKVGVDGFPGLTGVSLSMLGEFSFYQKGEIQRLRPYKIGAGFLAKNAFNFNPDADRDLGIVILGSVYPSRKKRKISFPLYAGFGYFLNEERFFYLIGPGIRINF